MFTVIITVIVFSFLIFFHELGHFMAAKLSKIDVLEFSIGMGPAIFKKQVKETQYSIRIFPIGGYCKMEGEEEESKSDSGFSDKPLYKRFFVIVAGSFMNFAVGFLLLIVITIMAQQVGTTTVARFRENADSQAEGLMVGDRIIKMNDTDINISDDIVYYLTSRGEDPVDITIMRNNEKMTISNVNFPYEAVDKSEITGDISDKGEIRKMVYSDFYVTSEKITPLLVIKNAFFKSISIAKLVWVSFIDLLTGRMGLSDLSGPVGVGSAIGSAASAGVNSLLYLVIFITINLGVVNLLPLPALDGGRLVFLLFELVTRKKVPPSKENAVHFVGLVLFLILAVVVAYQDIMKLIIK